MQIATQIRALPGRGGGARGWIGRQEAERQGRATGAGGGAGDVRMVVRVVRNQASMGFAAQDVRNWRGPMAETETDDCSDTSAPAGAAVGGVDEFLPAVRYERASMLEPLVRQCGTWGRCCCAGSRRRRPRTSTAPWTLRRGAAPRTNSVGSGVHRQQVAAQSEHAPAPRNGSGN